MIFDSYIVSDTKTSLSMSLLGSQACPPPRKLKHSKGFEHSAFTLAETLITLTIIGVVAALTIPNLLNKYTKHTYVVGLKKAYSQLSNAMKMIPITEGCSAGDYDCAGIFQGTQYINGQYVNIPVTNIDGQDFGGDTGKKNIYLLSKQFKIQNINYKTLPEYNFISGAPTYSFTTNNGTIYMLQYDIFNSYVDINGLNGPNTVGRDIFGFNTNSSTGIVEPRGINSWENNCTTANVKNKNYDAIDCTARVLEEDAMNY